jgi:uncharacterized protein YggT (Ycf19 family)
LRGGTRIHTTEVSEHSSDTSVVRAQLFISYIVSTVSALLFIRIILSLLGANRANAFADVMYGITNPLVAPFQGLFNYSTTYGVSRFEIETVVAIVVYALLGLVIAGILNMGRSDIEDVDMDV